MTSLINRVAAATTTPFASLLGARHKASAKAKAEGDDDDKKKREGESDEDYAKRMDEMDAKAKAESEGDKKPEDDGDDKEKAKASAVAADRARCAAIIAHGIECSAIRQACCYAFDTNMSAETAIATIDATAEDRKLAAPSLAARMQQEHTPAVAQDAPGVADPGTVAAVVAQAKAAMAKARGEKPTT